MDQDVKPVTENVAQNQGQPVQAPGTIQEQIKQVIADLDAHIKMIEDIKKNPTEDTPAMNYDEMIAVLQKDKNDMLEKLNYFDNNVEE